MYLCKYVFRFEAESFFHLCVSPQRAVAFAPRSSETPSELCAYLRAYEKLKSKYMAAGDIERVGARGTRQQRQQR